MADKSGELIKEATVSKMETVQAVKRNENRFPSDFRFRLEMEEYRSLISQIVTSKNVLGETHGGHQYCAVTKMDAMFIPSIMEKI